MKVLFTGVIENAWESGAQRLKAMNQIGIEAIGVSTTALQKESRHLAYARRFLPASVYEWILSPNARGLHELLLTKAAEIKPDVFWFEWPRMISKETIIELKKRFPNALVVSYQDDNPFGTRRFASYSWQRFFDAMPYYDLHLVKRESDIPQYKSRGATNVEVLLWGYAEDIFYPEAVPDNPSTPEVVFIGTALDQRVPFLDKLTGKLGVEVHVYGGRWDRTALNTDRKHLIHGSLTDADYRKVVCGAKIALGFVSHTNLDEYTGRLFEVPACGTMFLGESTELQKTLYVENKEVVFFNSPEDCRDKINYYLSHPEEREQIAAAGRQRALGYGCRDMMRTAEKLICKYKKS